jgi:hypothetical protein
VSQGEVADAGVGDHPDHLLERLQGQQPRQQVDRLGADHQQPRGAARDGGQHPGAALDPYGVGKGGDHLAVDQEHLLAAEFGQHQRGRCGLAVIQQRGTREDGLELPSAESVAEPRARQRHRRQQRRGQHPNEGTRRAAQQSGRAGRADCETGQQRGRRLRAGGERQRGSHAAHQRPQRLRDVDVRYAASALAGARGQGRYQCAGGERHRYRHRGAPQEQEREREGLVRRDAREAAGESGERRGRQRKRALDQQQWRGPAAGAGREAAHAQCAGRDAEEPEAEEGADGHLVAAVEQQLLADQERLRHQRLGARREGGEHDELQRNPMRHAPNPAGVHPG